MLSAFSHAVYNPSGTFEMHIRVMTEQDIPAGLRLNTIVGWNQTAADWRCFLQQSAGGCFVAEIDDKVVGTASTISYEGRFAWIGMVLVDPEFRKLGIGTKLLRKTIEHLEQIGVPTMKLDATPFGKPIYEKLGFVTEYEIERWLLKRPPQSAHLRTAPPAELADICELDRELFGADRSFLLRSLYEQAPELAVANFEEGFPPAYAFGRHGLFADHLGPWSARSRTSAEELLQSFLRQSSRETVIVDVMKSNSMAIEVLARHGFTPSRPLTRMFRGPNTHPGKADDFCAILGPEFG
jgi:GNAT superfamily N-acetyltransferase